MLVNQPDLARYCKDPRNAGILQGLSLFLSSVIVFFLGLASTASVQAIWGTAYWNIWGLLDEILDHNWNAGAWTGIFFVAVAFLLGVFATNFGANTIPFGSDMTGLFPRWLGIRRGQILGSFLGVAVVPWKLIASAQSFLSFLGSYNIFMAPLCAVILVTHANDTNPVDSRRKIVKSAFGPIIGRRKMDVSLPQKGIVAGTSVDIPGLIGQYQPAIISTAAQDMYKMGWILTFVTAGVVYFVRTKFINYQVFPTGQLSTPMKWGWLANGGREGFYDGENHGSTTVDGMSVSSVLEQKDMHVGEKEAQIPV